MKKDPLNELVDKSGSQDSNNEEQAQKPPFVYFSRKRADDDEEAPTMLWLITFTDIMALMLTFFVLLYSMSVPKEETWKEISTGISREFRKYHSAAWNAGAQQAININKVDFSDALNLGYLQSVLQEVIENDERLRDVVIIPQKDHLILSLPQSLLFEKGEASVMDKGRQIIYTLGAPLSRIRNRIEVIGHSDPDPVNASGSDYKNNWSLSLARAADVSANLSSAGYERPITLRGFSTGRYEDLPEDMPLAQKEALSRRVDIMIMRDSDRTQNWWD